MGIFNLFSKEYMSLNQIQKKSIQIANDYDKVFSQNINGTPFQRNLIREQITNQFKKKHNLFDISDKGFSFITYLDDTFYVRNVDEQGCIWLSSNPSFCCNSIRMYSNYKNDTAQICLNDIVNLKVKIKVYVEKTYNNKMGHVHLYKESAYNPAKAILINSRYKIVGRIV